MKGREFYDPRISFQIDCADAFDWLREILPDSIDLVITDPPYESLEKHRAKGTTTRLKVSSASSNEWFEVIKNRQLPELFCEVYRVLRVDAHFYLFCDWETQRVAVPMLEAAGFKVWKAIIWDKMTIGMGYHYRAQHEYIIFAEKGKRRLLDLGVPDVLQFKRVHGGYPTEKPVSLLAVLVSQSSLPGELVVDPFSGSGSTGCAAIKGERAFRGCDKKKCAVTLAEGRFFRWQGHRI